MVILRNHKQKWYVLKQLLLEIQLQALNTKFQKKVKFWISYANGARAQSDYILINSKWKNSLTNCEGYNSKATVKSDHLTITAQVRLSLRSNIKIKNPPQFV